jgi:hypothetical protein
MRRDDVRPIVRQRLVKVLTAIQRNAGREAPEITDDTIPFDHLPGFDSVNGVEAAVMLSADVSVEIDSIPFVAPADGHRMCVREIVDSICQQYGATIVGKPAASASPENPSTPESAAGRAPRAV